MKSFASPVFRVVGLFTSPSFSRGSKQADDAKYWRRERLRTCQKTCQKETSASRVLLLVFFLKDYNFDLNICLFQQKDELFKNIDLTLNGSASEGLVRVVCCGRDTGLSLRYVNETAVTFVWVEVRNSITGEYNLQITEG